MSHTHNLCKDTHFLSSHTTILYFSFHPFLHFSLIPHPFHPPPPFLHAFPSRLIFPSRSTPSLKLNLYFIKSNLCFIKYKFNLHKYNLYFIKYKLYFNGTHSRDTLPPFRPPPACRQFRLTSPFAHASRHPLHPLHPSRPPPPISPLHIIYNITDMRITDMTVCKIHK